jgi:hypothetical protein
VPGLKSKGSWGGARPGSGRPRKHPKPITGVDLGAAIRREFAALRATEDRETTRLLAAELRRLAEGQANIEAGNSPRARSRRGPQDAVLQPAAAHDMSTRLERIAFKTSRLLDFIGERELTAQIGHQPDIWLLVCLKELLDNALDAAEEAQIAPEIRVEVSTEPDAAGITVADNGPGIPAETVSDILDFSTRTSHVRPTVRLPAAPQGNALKTVVAMPYALSGGTCGETRIESRGIIHRISFRADAVLQKPRIEHRQDSAIVKKGTSITVLWPDSACSYLDGQEHDFLQTAAGYAVLNPHLSLQVHWDGEPVITWSSSDGEWHPFRACDPTSAYWYDVPRLARYGAAHLARDQARGQTGTVRDFIAEFRGLSGSVKQKIVLEQSGLARQPLAALFDDGAVNTQRVNLLLNAMCEHTRPVKPRDLGIIGAAHMWSYARSSAPMR